ncbi:BON domain-containing protein [Candidatus Microgenomates bacterium]|jgi:uncharacterized ubiquitin-like protein YukD|nr:MAG: BON domain-containing protein [Candidatus Microgenomates bacterium]
MAGFKWGNWNYPPWGRGVYTLPYRAYQEGSCADYQALDLRLMTDEDLRENVIWAIYANPEIPKEEKDKIEVKAKNKTVVLSGKVKNRKNKIRAFVSALQTPGARSVKNNIKVA